ncbi:hypothetical protein SLA2020_472980 [Shorea laevis]
MAAMFSFLVSPISNLVLSLFFEKLGEPMFLFLFLFSFSVSLLFFFSYLHRKVQNQKERERRQEGEDKVQNDPSLLKRSLEEIVEKTQQAREKDSTHFSHSLLFEILPTDSAKWGCLFGEEKREEGPGPAGSGQEELCDLGGDHRAKKKKKRAKKKRLDSKSEENGEDRCSEVEKEDSIPGARSRLKPELVCLYPFTSTSSATQRKIKQQYEQLMKCHENKGLTLTQVWEFANCLIEARNELQHKSGVIKRKFTITKALLLKADRSSFDRLRQQIYKLEMEQKRLEEDAFVYNWLQQQLKLSPAYKKMLEIGECMELKAKAGELMQDSDTECSDISFEELLAQEKKDSFWQKNGKSRLSSS